MPREKVEVDRDGGREGSEALVDSQRPREGEDPARGGRDEVVRAGRRRRGRTSRHSQRLLDARSDGGGLGLRVRRLDRPPRRRGGVLPGGLAKVDGVPPGVREELLAEAGEVAVNQGDGAALGV